MDISKILDELRDERRRIDETIMALERLSVSSGHRRRGRPPAWLTAARAESGEQPGKRRGRPKKEAE